MMSWQAGRQAACVYEFWGGGEGIHRESKIYVFLCLCFYNNVNNVMNFTLVNHMTQKKI